MNEHFRVREMGDDIKIDRRIQAPDKTPAFLGSIVIHNHGLYIFYIEAEGLEDGNNKYIGTYQDSSNNDAIRLRLNQSAGQLRLRFSVYTNGAYEDHYADIGTNTWYRLDVKYDNTDNTWEASLSDVDGSLLDHASGTLTGTHYTGIQKWNLGFMLGSQAYTGVICYDLFVVNTISYYYQGRNPAGYGILSRTNDWIYNVLQYSIDNYY